MTPATEKSGQFLYVGNYPEFAEWLATLPVDSMSLNPDSLPTVAQRPAVT